MVGIMLVIGAFAVAIAFVYFIVWAMVRASEEKGRAEAAQAIRDAQHAEALRRLKNALDADAKSRADSAAGGLYNDDGHRRD